MNTDQLLQRLAESGTRLWVDGNELRLDTPSGALPDDLRAQVLQMQRQIIDRLDPQANGSPMTGRIGRPLPPSPLSPVQEQFWFHEHLAGPPSLHNIPAALEISGVLEVARLATTIATAVRRHEALRVVIAEGQEGPSQRLIDPSAITLRTEDLSQIPTAERQAAALERMREEARLPFDLSKGPLFRPVLWRLSDNRHVLQLTLHHIIADGRSVRNLLADLLDIYRLAPDGIAPPPRCENGFLDHCRQQRDLQATALREHTAYWVEALEGAPAVSLPPPIRPHPAVPSHQGATERLTLDPELVGAIDRLARQERTTPFVVFLSAWAALIAGLSGQSDCVLGYLNANRTADTADLVGLCVNPLPIRLAVSRETDLRALLAATHARFVEGLRHSDVAFSRIVEAVKPARTMRHNPIFQTLVVFDTISPLDTTDLGWSVEQVQVDDTKAKLDLTLFVSRTQGIEISLEYNCDIFDRNAARLLLDGLSALITAGVTEPSTPVGRLPLMDAAMRNQILYGWNETACDYGPDKRLDALIARQVARSPERIAVIQDDAKPGAVAVYTYRELDARAGHLAATLCESGAGPGCFVAVFMDRTPDLLVALYAVLKSGAGFVPVDPSYPDARVAFILRDAQVPVVLTESHLIDRVVQADATVIALDRWSAGSGTAPAGAGSAVGAGDPAYLIYTSGSTGEPKGALNSHGAICNRLAWMQATYRLDVDDNVFAKTPIGFDVALWELFWPLICGGRLVMARPNGHRDPDYLLAAILRNRVTVAHFVPPMLRMFLGHDDSDGLTACAGQMKRIIASGEALSPDLRDQFFARLPGVALHNLYGPSEAAIDVTAFDCHPGDRSDPVPIGRPIANTRIYVLDPDGVPVPPGVAGELHIGGANVGLGYWNRPTLTRQRFIADPFSTDGGARLFRTGDRARYRSDGNVEFLGRIDHQVKIRGYRVEPEEIEAVLCRHPMIADAMAVASKRPNGNLALSAYWVAEPGTSGIDELAIRQHLEARLPAAMIPEAFHCVAAIPLTANGKRDRRALAAASLTNSEAATDSRLDTAVARTLSGIWGDVLNRRQIGSDDSFFDLGGDSIRVIDVVYRARAAGLLLTVEQVFEHQTIRRLSAVVASHAPQLAEAAPATPAFALVDAVDRRALPEDVEDAAPLTMLQSGLVYQSMTDPRRRCYVTSLRLAGPFRRDCLEDAIAMAVTAHPMMRMAIDFGTAREPLQVVHRDVAIPLKVFDLRELAPSARTASLTAFLETAPETGFDWARPPLFRFWVHRLDPDTFQLTLAEPMLDGWSVALFLSCVVESYGRMVANAAGATPRGGAPPVLPAETGLDPPFRIGDLVAAERAALASSQARQFWTAQLVGAPRTFLPHWPASTPPGARYIRRPITIDPALQKALRETATRHSVPLKTVLLAAHCRIVGHLSGQRSILTGLMAHRRPEIPAASHQVGLFLNVLPLRVNMPASHWGELIKEVHRAEAVMLAHRDYPFAQILRDQSEPLFDTLFNFVHFRPYERLADGPVRLIEVEAFDQTYFDLTAQFSVSWQTGDIGLRLDFNAASLPDEEIAAICRAYRQTLTLIATGEEGSCHGAFLLTEEDTAILHPTCVGPCRQAPPDACFPDMFARQAAATPDAVAATDGRTTVSYHQLQEEARTAANRLVAAGVTPGGTVAWIGDRSLDTLRIIQGILLAGAAYLPLDPDWPRMRLLNVLRNSACGHVVAGDAAAAAFAKNLCGALESDRLAPTVLSAAHCLRPEQHDPAGLPVIRSDAPAYILYTSGSSGAPKGAIVRHDGMLNHLLAKVDDLNLSGTSAVAQSARLSFDISIWQFLAPLLVGGRTEIVGTDVASNPPQLASFVATSGITVLEVVPSVMRLVLEDLDRGRVASSQLAGLEWLVVTGEAFPRDLHVGWRRHFPDMGIMNAYGPTECSDDVAHFVGDGDIDGCATVPIGRAIRNTELIVVDPALQPVPVGTPGELLVRGTCVGDGYLNDPAQTETAFIDLRRPGRPAERVYRTGDLVRVLPKGGLQFLGRGDQQIKLHGHRIEIGEIEAVLRRAPGVRDGVVVKATVAGRDVLVAHIVIAAGGDAPTARRYLEARLPRPWLPSHFIELARLPTTATGKIDRAALPVPAGLQDRRQAAPSRPQTDFERRIAGLWEEVLSVSGIGLDDDFYDLGGDSLTAIRLASRVAGATGCEMPLKALLAAPTVAKYCAVLTARGAKPHPAERTDHAPPPCANQAGAPRVRFEQRSLLTLACTDHFGDIEAAAIGYLPDILLRETGLDRDTVIRRWFDGGLPRIRQILRTPLGQIAHITLPILASELHDGGPALRKGIADAVAMARRLGAHSVALTGLIPSATDQGRSLSQELVAPGAVPALTTGHAITAAAVVLSIADICLRTGRPLNGERLGVLGLGSIGVTALRLLLRHFPHPASITLCDLFGKRDRLAKLRDELRRDSGFTGSIETIVSCGRTPADFYRSTLILGATSIPDVLEVAALAPGTLVIDDSAPHCFDAVAAVRRMAKHSDILVGEGGFLRAPHAIEDVRDRPADAVGADVFNRLQRYAPGRDEVMGCLLSGLIHARYPDLPSTIGPVEDDVADRTFRRLREAGFAAASLACLRYRVPDATIAGFLRGTGGGQRRRSD